MFFCSFVFLCVTSSVSFTGFYTEDEPLLLYTQYLNFNIIIIILCNVLTCIIDLVLEHLSTAYASTSSFRACCATGES